VVDEKLPDIIDTGYSILRSILKGIGSNIGSVVEAGADILVNFIKGLENKTGEALDAGADFIINFIDELADTIVSRKQELYDALEKLFDAVLGDALKFVKNKAKEFAQFGTDIANGLKKGITDKKDAVVGGVKDLANGVIGTAKNIFDTNSPSEVFIKIGEDIIAGLTGGITDSSDDALNAIGKVGGKVNKAGAKVAKDAGKAAKDAFDADVAWINERKYYNKLTLKEELEAWEYLNFKYMEHAEYRKKTAREIYRVENELGAAQFKNSLDWIEEKKFFNELALSENLAAWKRVQKRYIDGELDHVTALEEQEKAKRNIYTLEQKIAKLNKESNEKIEKAQESAAEKRIKLEEEYYDKTKEINEKLNDDIDKLVGDYESAVDRRAQTLYDAYGIFQKVELEDPTKGSILINNLEDQVETMTIWRNQLNLLKARGVNTELISELQDLGPQSIQKIRALTKLSEGELDKFVGLWQEKHRLARERAGYELSDVRDETYSTITQITKESNKELQEYQKVWTNRFKELTSATQDELREIRDIWLESLGDMRTEADDELLAMMNNMIYIVGSDEWSELGSTMINGVMYGMQSEEERLLLLAGSLGKKALIAIKDGYGASDFEKSGTFSINGIVSALKEYNQLLSEGVSNFSPELMDRLRTPFNWLTDFLALGMDLSPVITPVLDTSNLEEELANTFSGTRSIFPEASSQTADKLNFLTGEYDYNSKTGSGQTETQPNAITVNNEYIVRDDSDIQRISVDLEDTLDRYNYAKGVVVTE